VYALLLALLGLTQPSHSAYYDEMTLSWIDRPGWHREGGEWVRDRRPLIRGLCVGIRPVRRYYPDWSTARVDGYADEFYPGPGTSWWSCPGWYEDGGVWLPEVAR
jgi:hypothetical protein